MSRNWSILITHVDSFDLPLDESSVFLPPQRVNPYKILGGLTQISAHNSEVLLTLAMERRAYVRDKIVGDRFAGLL